MCTSCLGDTVGCRWGARGGLAPAGSVSLEPLLQCPTHVCFVFVGFSPLARGRLKITALTIKVPALWPLTTHETAAGSHSKQPSQRRKWRGRGLGARPPCINIKGQSLLPGTQAKFPSYLQPGPQWGIVLGLKGHCAARSGPRRTPPGRANTAAVASDLGERGCVLLLGERLFLQGSVGAPDLRVLVTPFWAPVSSPGPWWSACTPPPDKVRRLSCAVGLAAGGPPSQNQDVQSSRCWESSWRPEGHVLP